MEDGSERNSVGNDNFSSRSLNFWDNLRWDNLHLIEIFYMNRNKVGKGQINFFLASKWSEE